MKLRSYIFTLLCLLVFSVANLYGQEDKVATRLLKPVKKAYEAMKYAEVISLLEKSADAVETNTALTEMLADSYKKTKDYKKALSWYQKLATKTPVNANVALAYAEVLANNEQYSASENWYQQYAKLAGNDQRAQNFIAAYAGGKSFMKDKKNWHIYYTNLNTAASEYAPMYYNNGLVFVSNRQVGKLVKSVFAYDQTPFSDLYFANNLDSIKAVNTDSLLAVAKTKNISYRVNDDNTPASSNDTKVITISPKLLNDSIGTLLNTSAFIKPLEGFVNTKYHEGPVAVLPDGSLMFTRNNYVNGKTKSSKEGITKLNLFVAKAPGLDAVVPFKYNDDDYSTGHPALNKAGTILIFASDKPGGKGKVDLYMSTRANVKEEWGTPVNLGDAINTEGDELFPTLYNDSTLFFASNGHAGLGGLDIFEVGFDNGTIIGKPTNLGAPVNSSTDDFALIRKNQSGFFTSNRRGNDDIYGFKLRDFAIKFKGVLTDEATKQPLPNAQIQYIINEVRTSFYTDANGNFEHELPKRSDLTITVNKPGYALFSQKLPTFNFVSDTTIVQNIGLNNLNKNVLNEDKCKEIYAFAEMLKVYFDVDKSEIRPDAKPILNKVVSFLKLNPQVQIITASYCDTRGSKAYNVALANRRSQSTKNHLVANGIAPGRIIAHAFGEDNLVNHCTDGIPCDEAHQQLNRRTELFIFIKGKKLAELKCEDLTSIK